MLLLLLLTLLAGILAGGVVPGHGCNCCTPIKTPNCHHPCACPCGPPPLPSCPPPQPRIACAIDTDNDPCPLPPWNATWDLARSTAIQPCNTSGFYDPEFAAKWGLVSFDWSNAKDLWLAQTPHTCEELLVEQCHKVKQINPETKCFVYRNTELALEWLSSQRAVMDELHRDWFVQYQDDAVSTAAAKCRGAGTCDKNNGICCAFGKVIGQNQAPWKGERQFAWDFTNESLQAWWVDNMFLGKNAVGGSPYVDGCFSDDVDGFPREQESWLPQLGYSLEQLQALQVATQQTWQRAVEKLVSQGGYNWQMFGQGDGPRGTGMLAANCTQHMRTLCEPRMQQRPMLMPAGGGPNFEQFNQTLAAFLITRPPFAYIGYGWKGCGAASKKVGRDYWEPLFDLDVGEPRGGCEEGPSGVFHRAWSLGNASLDCNTFSAHLNFSLKTKSVHVGFAKTDDDDEVAPVARTRLFFDEQEIAANSMSNVRLRLHKPTVHDDEPPTLVPQSPWEGGRFNYYNSVVDNGTHVLLYYDVRGQLPDWKSRMLCVAVSRDGISFTRPNLGVGLYNGSRANNIVWPLDDRYLAKPPTPFAPGTVWRDDNPTTSDTSRWKMITGWEPSSQLHNTGSRVLTSPDGIHWKPIQGAGGDTVPVWSGSDTQDVMFYDPKLSK